MKAQRASGKRNPWKWSKKLGAKDGRYQLPVPPKVEELKYRQAAQTACIQDPSACR